MGHNILQQRRGRGVSNRFMAPSHRYYGKIKYRNYDAIDKDGFVNGKIVNLINCPGHSAPLMEVKYETGEKSLLVAPDNINVNYPLMAGSKAEPKVGNVLPLKNIPVDASIFNLEINPGDGGKLVRSAGTSARILSATPNKIIIKLHLLIC